MNLREIGWEIVDWIHLAQDGDQWRPLVDKIMNRRFPKKSGTFLTSCINISFSRMILLRGIR
jgi:hypothetical protein